MAKANVPLLSFNRGEVSPLALTRLDIERVQLSAETMINWMPKTLGPMSIRGGLIYKGATKSNAYSNWLPFVASTEDTALLEFTSGVMRVWVNDAALTIPAVSTTVADGGMATGVGWTDSSDADSNIGFGSGYMTLHVRAAGMIARATQTISVLLADRGVRHSLKVVIPNNTTVGYNNPPRIRLGSTSGDDDLIEETRLLPGEHHLAFTPTTANIYLDLFYADRYAGSSLIDSCQIEAAGTLEVTTPWTSAAQLDALSFGQSADVMFVACTGVRQQRIERRSGFSWSVVDYVSNDGPFIGQTVADVQLKGDETGIGAGTLTANRNFFKPEHEGALFRLFHNGQKIEMRVGRGNQFSDPVRVSGVTGTNYNDREFTFVVTGTWVGTLKTQRSILGPDTGFYEYPADASAATTIAIVANGTFNNEDMDDNLIAWYRMGFADGDYTSGRATIAVSYKGGGDYGIVKIGDYLTPTTVTYSIIRALRGETYTDNWSEGAWSGVQGYPTCVALYEGRLWWVGGAQIYASVSDNFESYDQAMVGDAGPIVRSIGDGPVDQINFVLPLGRLLIGTTGGEFVVKSSSIDESLTPSNYSIRPISSYGSMGPFPAVRIDDRGIFVHRSEGRLLEIAPANTPSGYNTSDLTVLHPRLLQAGVVSMAVQNQPDTRIHCVLADGSVAVLTYNNTEQINCWSRVQTDGVIERVVVLPGVEEDQVYYVVKRTIGGSDKRYLEKWAMESDTEGGTLNLIADSLVTYSGAATTSITGLAHLAGESVVVWANGNCIEESDGAGGMRPKLHVVSAGGVVTLDAAATSAVVGLPYTAQWKSCKLAYAAQGGTALTMQKRPINLGVVLYKTHHRGLKFGRDFTHLDPISPRVEGADVATGTIHDTYDHEPMSMPGNYGSDSRLCLQGEAPYPVTVLGLSLGMIVNEKG